MKIIIGRPKEIAAYELALEDGEEERDEKDALKSLQPASEENYKLCQAATGKSLM